MEDACFLARKLRREPPSTRSGSLQEHQRDYFWVDLMLQQNLTMLGAFLENRECQSMSPHYAKQRFMSGTLQKRRGLMEFWGNDG